MAKLELVPMTELARKQLSHKFLICGDCGFFIDKQENLVDGSSDPHDKRCPECGCGSFLCAFCEGQATDLRFLDKKVTWNCELGCNP